MEAGREPGSWCLPLAAAEAGALGSLCVIPVRHLEMGLSMVVSSGISLGLRALPWFACVDPVTHRSGLPYCPSFGGGLGPCTGAVACGRRHLPFPIGGCHPRVPCVCAWARSPWLGRAGRPPLSFGCSVPSALLRPLRAGFAPLRTSSLPSLVSLLFFSPCISVCPRCLLLSLVSGFGCPEP